MKPNSVFENNYTIPDEENSENLAALLRQLDVVALFFGGIAFSRYYSSASKLNQDYPIGQNQAKKLKIEYHYSFSSISCEKYFFNMLLLPIESSSYRVLSNCWPSD